MMTKKERDYLRGVVESDKAPLGFAQVIALLLDDLDELHELVQSDGGADAGDRVCPIESSKNT